MEIWKSYIEGYYEASNQGRIRSVDRVLIFKGSPGVRKGVVLKQTLNSKGYLTVIICKDGERKTEYVHRIIAKVFIENPLNKPEVNHKNGQHTEIQDNAVENLEWCTYDENILHAYENNLTSTGNVKLSEAEVSEIKYLIKAGLSNPEIGKIYGVDKATIRNIRIGRSWTHVK